MMSARMKALVVHAYGGPDVLRLVDVWTGLNPAPIRSECGSKRRGSTISTSTNAREPSRCRSSRQ